MLRIGLGVTDGLNFAYCQLSITYCQNCQLPTAYCYCYCLSDDCSPLLTGARSISPLVCVCHRARKDPSRAALQRTRHAQDSLGITGWIKFAYCQLSTVNCLLPLPTAYCLPAVSSIARASTPTDLDVFGLCLL
jgi:hypothetical protein